MSNLICIDNLKKYEFESQIGAVRLKSTAVYFLMPYIVLRYPHLFIKTFWLFWQMKKYFKQASLARLTECCDLEKDVCRGCIKRIYENEKASLAAISQDMIDFPIIGRMYRHIKDILEDRAEALILSADDQAYEAVSRLVAHISTQDQNVSDWRCQLDTLQ